MPVKYTQIEIAENTFQVCIDYSDLDIDTRKIGLAIGYPNGELPPHLEEMIHRIISELPDRCEIQAGYRIVDSYYSTENKDGLFIGNHFFTMNKIVTSQFKKANYAAIFLCTIGPKMEEWMKTCLSGGDLILGYLMDITASTAVESVADLLYDQIGSDIKTQRWNMTNRYSPGYCNWSVAEQQALFSLLPDHFCHIKLTDSSLMIPIKSVSGVIGLGENVKYAAYTCDRCEVPDCTHRAYLQSKRAYQESQINDNSLSGKEL